MPAEQLARQFRLAAGPISPEKPKHSRRGRSRQKVHFSPRAVDVRVAKRNALPEDHDVFVIPESLQFPFQSERKRPQPVRQEIIKARQILQGGFMPKQENQFHQPGYRNRFGSWRQQAQNYSLSFQHFLFPINFRQARGRFQTR